MKKYYPKAIIFFIAVFIIAILADIQLFFVDEDLEIYKLLVKHGYAHFYIVFNLINLIFDIVCLFYLLRPRKIGFCLLGINFTLGIPIAMLYSDFPTISELIIYMHINIAISLIALFLLRLSKNYFYTKGASSPKIQISPVSYKNGMKMWWWILWRSILTMIFFVTVISFIISPLEGANLLTQNQIGFIMLIFIPIIYFLSNVYYMRELIARRVINETLKSKK